MGLGSLRLPRLMSFWVSNRRMCGLFLAPRAAYLSPTYGVVASALPLLCPPFLLQLPGALGGWCGFLGPWTAPTLAQPRWPWATVPSGLGSWSRAACIQAGRGLGAGSVQACPPQGRRAGLPPDTLVSLRLLSKGTLF